MPWVQLLLTCAPWPPHPHQLAPTPAQYYLCIQVGLQRQTGAAQADEKGRMQGAAQALPPCTHGVCAAWCATQLVRHAPPGPGLCGSPQSERLGYTISFSEFGGMEIEENWDKASGGRGGCTWRAGEACVAGGCGEAPAVLR